MLFIGVYFTTFPGMIGSSILFFKHPATGVAAKNCGVTRKYHFFSWFFPAPGVDEFVERWIIDYHPQ